MKPVFEISAFEYVCVGIAMVALLLTVMKAIGEMGVSF